MNYAKMKVAELRELATELGIMNAKSFKKVELVQLLVDIEKKKDEAGKKRSTNLHVNMRRGN